MAVPNVYIHNIYSRGTKLLKYYKKDAFKPYAAAAAIAVVAVQIYFCFYKRLHSYQSKNSMATKIVLLD